MAERIDDADCRLACHGEELGDRYGRVGVLEVGVLVKETTIFGPDGEVLREFVRQANAKDHRRAGLYGIGGGVMCGEKEQAATTQLRRGTPPLCPRPLYGVGDGEFVHISLDRSLGEAIYRIARRDLHAGGHAREAAGVPLCESAVAEVHVVTKPRVNCLMDSSYDSRRGGCTLCYLGDRGATGERIIL